MRLRLFYSLDMASSRPQELPQALPSLEICQQARLSRDPRFDGRFFIGVLSTGIFCRTTCPARMPKEENVRYYATAAAAQEAGYRPCRRCRPEAAQRLPEWTLSSETVQRALRNIEAGYLSNGTVADLAAELGIGERHLNRVFREQLGASVAAVAKLCRARLAHKLLRSSTMKLADVAFHAGYGSISRFNAEVRQVFQATPGQLRKRGKHQSCGHITFYLPVRLPYDFAWMFEYLKRRALAGLEQVEQDRHGWCYQRRVPGGVVRIYADAGSEAGVVDSLRAELPLVEEPLHSLLARVRNVFDLNTDGQCIHDSLAGDTLLGTWVNDRPGLRVPGAWDGYETAVRAVLGQQVSVERGTELAGFMVERYGGGFFPAPDVLADQEVAELGMPGQRGRAIAHLAKLVAAGELQLDECQAHDELQAQLEGIPGIGPWTANYIRMRVCRDPDAFPDNDWVVMKALNMTAAQARKRAAVWQPWRAYALMYLWMASPELRKSHSQTTAK